MSRDRLYFRPIPQAHGGRWRLAGGWTGFSQFERLQRGHEPVIVDSAPQDLIDTLTRPRADLLGLTLDRPRLMGIVNATPDSFHAESRIPTDAAADAAAIRSTAHAS